MARGIAPSRRAFQMAKQHGDPAFAAFAARSLISASFCVGPSARSSRASRRSEEHEFVRQFGFFLDRVSALLALVRTLRGRTTKFGSLDDGQLHGAFVRGARDRTTPHAFLECYYWIRKLQARFFAGDYGRRSTPRTKWRDGTRRCRRCRYSWWRRRDITSMPRSLVLHGASPWAPTPYTSIAKHSEHERAASGLGGKLSAELRGSCSAGRRRDCPCRRTAPSMPWTSTSAPSYRARKRLCPQRGDRQRACGSLLRGTRFRDDRKRLSTRSTVLLSPMGADGKVRQLECFILSCASPNARAAAATIAAPIEHLDIATVIKVSQAVSGEMELEKLIDALMRLAIEHAGAERGLLLLSRGDKLRQEAEAVTGAAWTSSCVRQDELEAAFRFGHSRHAARPGNRDPRRRLEASDAFFRPLCRRRKREVHPVPAARQRRQGERRALP